MDKDFSRETNVNGGSGAAGTEWDEMLQSLKEDDNEVQDQEIDIDEVKDSDENAGEEVFDETENGDDQNETDESASEEIEETQANTAETLPVDIQLFAERGEKENKKEFANLNPLKDLNNLTLYGITESEKFRKAFHIEDDDAIKLAKREIERRKEEGTFEPNADDKEKGIADFNNEFYVHNGSPKVVSRYGTKLRDVYYYEEDEIRPGENGGFGMYDDEGKWNWVEYEELDKKGKVFRRSDNKSLADALEKNCREEIKADLDNAEEIIENANIDEGRKSELLKSVYDRRYNVCKNKIRENLDNAEEIIENAKLDEERKRRLLNFVYRKRYGGYEEKVKADLDNAEEIIENAKLDEERKRWLLNDVYKKRYEGYKEKIKADLDNAEEIIENAKLEEWRKSWLLNDVYRKRYGGYEEKIKADLDNAEEIIENAKLDEERKSWLLNDVYRKRYGGYEEKVKADLDDAEEIINNAKLDEERKDWLLDNTYEKRYGGYEEKVKADLDNAEEIIENAKLDEERKRRLLNFVYNERYGGYKEKIKADLDNAEEIIENAKLDEWRKNRLYYDLPRIRSSKIDDLIDNLEKNSDNFEELVQGAGFNVDKISKECFLHRLCEMNGPESIGVERIAETILGRNPREFVEWLAEERGKQDRAGKARFTRFYNSSPTFLQCREIVDEENRQMREETEALNKIRNADKKMIWEATSLDDVKKIIKEMGSLDNARKQIAQEYDENGAIEVSSMEPGKWRLDVESHSSEKKKETPVTFGIRKVEAVTNLAKLVSEINPDTNVQLVKGTFPREDKEAGSSSGRYDNAYMRAAGTYLGFMFEYNGQKCVMAESFGDDAATYLYRCPKDKNPLDYFARTKQSNYQDNPNCAVVDHLSKENIGISIAEVQQKALRFFTENLVDENGHTVLDENGNPLPNKNIVFYKSEGGREKWERNFGSKYNYTLPELKDEYSEGEKESIRQIIETSKAQLSAYEKWLEEHDVFNAK